MFYWPNGMTPTSDPDIAKMKAYTQWARPTEMNGSDAPSLWGSKGKPLPMGSAQGGLGDCWFLAGASSVAENADRVKRFFWNDAYDPNGIFRMYFWVKGQWHGVNIDDQLPARPWGRGVTTRFNRKSVFGAWWMPLLEKSFAKFN